MAIIKISDLPKTMDLEQMMTVRGGAPGDGSGDGGLVCLGKTPVTCNGTTGITCDGGSALDKVKCTAGQTAVKCNGGSAVTCNSGSAI